MLAGKGTSSNIVFHALDKTMGINVAIIEQKETKGKIIKRRIKKLGYTTVIGQLIFQVFAVPIISFIAKKRIRIICNENNFEIKEIPDEKLVDVVSVNDDKTLEIILNLNPSVIILNGTRIISKKILQKIKCPVINMHAGITPTYRGVHGGYWALTQNDLKHCGVTVHLVDAGIDTGSILYQENIHPLVSDNFITYPYLQLAAGINILKRAISETLDGKLSPIASAGKSKLWYHPTIWEYLYYRFFKKIK